MAKENLKKLGKSNRKMKLNTPQWSYYDLILALQAVSYGHNRIHNVVGSRRFNEKIGVFGKPRLGFHLVSGEQKRVVLKQIF